MVNVCAGCRYFPACGEKHKSEPCQGKEVIPPDTDNVIYDHLLGHYVAEKNEHALPERYTMIFRGDKMYIETYDIGRSRRMSIAFTKEEVESGQASCKREAAMRENGIARSYMFSMTVPSDEFDRMIFGRGMEEEEDAEDKGTD